MRFLSIILLLLAFAACSTPNKQLIENAPYVTLRLKDDLGRELALKENPKRILSLAPSVTEMIYAAGAGDKLVGRSQSSNYPAEALSLPEITSFPEPDFEGMLELAPDLIIGTDEILPLRYLPSFEKLNLPVYLQKFDSLADVMRSLKDLGKMLGTENQANHLADSLSKIVQQVEMGTKAEIPYSCFLLVSAEPLIVVGGQGYIHEMLSKAGAHNIFSDLNEKYPRVTPEAILALKAEYIIVPDENGNILRELIDRYPALSQIPAIASNQVFSVNPDLIFRPGPRAIEGLVYLTRVFHPRVQVGMED